MTAIFSYDEWLDIVSRGTSGDQVHDILASWKHYMDNPTPRFTYDPGEDEVLVWQYDNEPDKFWKHDYHVCLHEFHYPPFKINADNEVDALDEAIDLAEELGWRGCFIENPTDYDYDTMTSGGNHGLVLSSENWLVAKL